MKTKEPKEEDLDKERELKIQRFGFDPTEPFQHIGKATIKHKERESEFEFYFSPQSNKIDVCYFGCNGTYLHGSLQKDKTTLPEEFNEPFLKLKEWYFSKERKEQKRQEAIEEAKNKVILEKAIKTNAREFAVQSSGHGSAFRFDGSDPCNPTLPPLTLEEAVTDCDNWVEISDTIGGNARIYHIPTKMTINFRKYRKK